VERVDVDVLQRPVARADERDLRLERAALTGEYLEQLIGVAMGQPRQLAARRLEVPSGFRHVAALSHVEEPDLDGHRGALPLDGALHQLLRADRRPADVVDRFGRHPRSLDEGAGIDQLEVAGEVEVARQDTGEIAPEAPRGAGLALERDDRDGERLAPGSEDAAGDDGASRAAPRQDGRHDEQPKRSHPLPRPPSSSEWKSMTTSRNSSR